MPEGQMPQVPSASLGIVPLIIILVVYAYFAYSLMVISQKTGKGTPWWGWVPILNVILLLQIDLPPS